jgi:hypothetical protein
MYCIGCGRKRSWLELLEEIRKTTENFRLCSVLGRHFNRKLPEFKPEALHRYAQYHALDISHMIDHQPIINSRVVKPVREAHATPETSKHMRVLAC